MYVLESDPESVTAGVINPSKITGLTNGEDFKFTNAETLTEPVKSI